MADWQLIETAPKDGRFVDIWTEYNDRVTDAKWDVKRNCWVHWALGGFDSMDYIKIGCLPTHWMPLPEPPE